MEENQNSLLKLAQLPKLFLNFSGFYKIRPAL